MFIFKKNKILKGFYTGQVNSGKGVRGREDKHYFYFFGLDGVDKVKLYQKTGFILTIKSETLILMLVSKMSNRNFEIQSDNEIISLFNEIITGIYEKIPDVEPETEP